jgi:hypothetical protein
MKMLGFGRPVGGLIQTAYIVPDIRNAVEQWTSTMKGGPWFLLENFAGEDSIYRGQPCTARAHAALGFVGNMQIELIQPLGDDCGIHRETALSRGYGFHHFGMSCEDAETERASYEAQGYTEVYRTRVPTGDMVYYMEAPNDQTGFIELITANATLDAAFTRMWRASLDWQGNRPLRPFEELFEG